MRPDFLSPVMLSTQLTDAASQTLSPYPFLNPNKSAMLVDQIRFSFVGEEANPTPFDTLLFATLDARIDIMMGGIPLTNGLIPMASLFPNYLGPTKLNGLDALGVYAAGATADYAATCHLERPLYVPYGTTFQIRITINQAEFFTHSIFSLHGRSLPQGMEAPKTIWVPWATGFIAESGPNYVCQDSDMANPHDSPLFVRHLQGCSNQVTAKLPATPSIQITTSSNRNLIRTPTPFKILFPDDRLILPLSAKLWPQEFLRVELTTEEPDGELPHVSVGMLGFRELPTPFAPGDY